MRFRDEPLEPGSELVDGAERYQVERFESRRTRDDAHWVHTKAIRTLPFLTAVADCFAAGLLAASLWRRGDATRTILIGRPRRNVHECTRAHAGSEHALALLLMRARSRAEAVEGARLAS
jgi:hypothetical protein